MTDTVKKRHSTCFSVSGFYSWLDWEEEHLLNDKLVWDFRKKNISNGLDVMNPCVN